MSASDVRAGRAYVEITAKDAKFKKGMEDASSSLNEFASGLRSIGISVLAVGTSIAGSLLGAIIKFASFGDAVDDQRQKVGLSAAAYTALAFAAEQNGASIESLEIKLKKMAKSLAAAAKEGGTVEDAIKRIGLSASALVNLSPEQQFLTLAEAISKVPNFTERSAIAMTIFGKSASDIIPLLSLGREGIEKFMQEARRLGLVMDDETAEAAGRLNDGLNKLRAQLKYLIVSIGGTLAPAISDIVDQFKEWGAKAINIIKQNAGFVRSLLAASGILVVLGAGIIAVSSVISSLSAIFSVVTGTVALAGLAFALVGKYIASLTTPIGLVMVALRNLASYFLFTGGQGKKITEFLINAFRTFAGEVQESFQAIVAALNAGNMTAAWGVVTALMTLQWVKFTSFLKSTWAEWKSYFMSLWVDAVTVFAVAANDGFGTIQAGWAETEAFVMTGWVLLQKGWDEFVTIARLAWNRLYTWMAKGIAYILEQLGLVEEGTASAVDQMAKDKAGEIMKDREESQAQRNEQLGKIETDREKRRAQIKEDGANREKVILDQSNTDKEKNNKAASDAENEAAKAVDDARKKWEDALNAANEARSQQGQEAATNGGQAAFEGFGEAKSVEARGTFNAAALQSLMGIGVQDQILEENKKQTELQKKIANNPTGSGAFA